MGKMEEAKLVKGLVPDKKTDTFVLGDLDEARKIAEHSLEVVQQFCEAVIREEIETAYGLCAKELQLRMSLQQFVARLAKADDEHGGKPISYFPERITWVYADEASREESNKEGDWPKNTPKQNKRALVGGWLTAQMTAEGEIGRSVFFWVTEECEGYRIAKFKQYVQ
jgi:hypothetical protein